MAVDPKELLIAECRVALMSITRDIEQFHTALLARTFSYDAYVTHTGALRIKQIEILNILIKLAEDPVGHWEKVIGH